MPGYEKSRPPSLHVWFPIDARLAENHIVLQPEIEIGGMDFFIDFARIALGIALVIRNFVEEELAGGLLVQVPENPSHSIAAKTFIEFFLIKSRKF